MKMKMKMRKTKTKKRSKGKKSKITGRQFNDVSFSIMFCSYRNISPVCD